MYTDCRRQKSSRQGAKPDLSGCIFDGDSCQKCFCVTFDESNKACAVFGANMTDKRKGKIAYGENDKCNDRKGSVNHNTRAFTAKNVDKNRSADNV